MDTGVVIALVVAALLLVTALAAWAWMRRRRTLRLRREFGPEYREAVAHAQSQGQAESELERRRERVEKLHIVPLEPREAGRLTANWSEIQSYFVDEPEQSMKQADSLVREVMQLRGYPMADFEQRAADLSVDHPSVVSRYRTAREISLRNELGEATTEDLRNAFLNYRELFNELLETETKAGQPQAS